MPMHNAEIADAFEDLADLLEVEDANPFRVRAYRNAARVIRSNRRRIADLAAEDLTDLPEVGEDLAQKIRALVETGELPALEEVRKRVPQSISEMMRIEGLGAKKVKALYEGLGVKGLEDLKQAAEEGRVAELEGFGEKTQEMILERAADAAEKEQRSLRNDAEDVAEPLLAYLEAIDGVKQVELAGSYRRRKETVGDLDILVTAERGTPVMQRFVDYDEVAEVASRGDTRSTVHLRSGMQVDLRLLPQVSFGAALHYFTGSKAHNVAVRKLGRKRGYKLNEYGVFEGDQRIAGRTEEDVFASLDLPYIPPDLRENRGEIEAAREDRLPDMVRLGDIRGDLHCHTRYTDGHAGLRAMAEAARELGREYLAITDHTQNLKVVNGLDAKRLRRQMAEIDRLNDELEGITLLKGAEVDILEDGDLDLPDDVLQALDLTVCSLHSKFDLPRNQQTERVLRALDHPAFRILGHPTGRRLNQRPPLALDLEKVMRAAAERGRFLEVSAQPDRLDLNDEACLLARELGVQVAISTDAHTAADLDLMRYGLEQARRGWLEKKHVINTRTLKQLQKLLQN